MKIPGKKQQQEKRCGRCYYYEPTEEGKGVCVCKRSEVYQRSIIRLGRVPTRKDDDQPCAAWRDILTLDLSAAALALAQQSTP